MKTALFFVNVPSFLLRFNVFGLNRLFKKRYDSSLSFISVKVVQFFCISSVMVSFRKRRTEGKKERRKEGKKEGWTEERKEGRKERRKKVRKEGRNFARWGSNICICRICS